MQTFVQRIIFNFPQFPVSQKNRYKAIFLVPRAVAFTFLFKPRTEVRKFAEKVGRMEVIYRNGVSRTGRSPRLMLTSSSLSSASSSSSSSFSFSFSPSSSSSLHRRPHTVRSTQTGKFRRCGNYVSRGLNFRLRRSTRGGVVNASAPHVADVGRHDAPGVRNGS